MITQMSLAVLVHVHAINVGPIFFRVGPNPPERRQKGARTGQVKPLEWLKYALFLCHPYCTHMQWMTYREGAILSLTHSPTHSLAHSAVSSMCNRLLCSAGSL